jgi:uncharacterized protein YndB with AHSA1/START domain
MSQNIRLVNRFTVPPETVFDAFTRPDAMRAWWTDDTVFEIDLREGGAWTITREEDGQTLVLTGEYLEVDRPRRLRYTIAMPAFSPNQDEVTIDIAEEEGGCVVTFEQSGPDIAAELEALAPGEESPSAIGWQQGFDLLAEAWNGHA